MKLQLAILILATFSTLALSTPTQADDIAGRTQFYETTPINDATLPGILDSLKADIPVLKAQGVVFTPVPSSSKPYPQAGFEIDFAHSKFTPATRALAQAWQKNRNYFAIRGQLENCGLATDKRQLDKRLIAVAGQVSMANMDCQTLEKETDPQIMQLSQVNQAFVTSQLEDIAINKALISAGHAYGYAAKRYPGPSVKWTDYCNANTGGFIYNDSFNECAGDVADTLQKAVAEGGQKVNPISVASLATELNARIDAVNGPLGLVQAKDTSTTHLKADPQVTSQVQQEYNVYAATYQTATAAPDGDLMLTDSGLSQVGHQRRLDKDGGGHWGTVTWPAHSHFTESSLTSSIADDRAALRGQMTMLNDMYIDKRNRENWSSGNDGSSTDPSKNISDLKKLLIDNPAAVGQALMEYPEAASSICSIIAGIEKDDQAHATRDKVFAVGLGVVGAIAIGTLVGSEVGVAAIGAATVLAEGGTGALTFAAVSEASAAAIAAGGTAATLSTAATYAAAAGVVLGAATTAYTANNWFQANTDFDDLQMGILAHTGDGESLNDLSTAYTNYLSARRSAIISGVGTAADFGALNYLLSLRKAGTGLTLMTQYLKDAEQAAASGGKVAGGLAHVESVLGNTPAAKQEIAEGLGVLSQGSQPARVSLLSKLASLSKEKIATLFEQAAKLTSKCGL